jgi:hypothetical protein
MSAAPAEPHGAAALAPDPVFPQRDTVLNPEVFGARLAGLLGAVGIDGCRWEQVKYRPGRDLQVHYRFGTGETRARVSVHVFASGKSAPVYRQALEAAPPFEGPPWVGHDPEFEAVFWVFPHDRLVRGLPALMLPSHDLTGLVPGWSRSVLVHYLPERTATVRCLDSEGATLAYAKAYADDRGVQTQRVHDALGTSLLHEHLRMPAALGYSSPWRILAVEPMAGPPLDQLDGTELEGGCRRLGSAVAALHATGIPDLPAFQRHSSPRLQRAAEMIVRTRSDVAAAARDLVDALDATGGRGATVPVCLHSDLKMPNVIVGPSGIGLVDLDTVALGPAEADLAHFLGTLRYDVCRGRRTAPEALRLESAFLDGYRDGGGRYDPAALNWHTAASMLIKRAAHLVSSPRAGALRHLPAVMAAAAGALEGTAWQPGIPSEA